MKGCYILPAIASKRSDRHDLTFVHSYHTREDPKERDARK